MSNKNDNHFSQAHLKESELNELEDMFGIKDLEPAEKEKFYQSSPGLKEYIATSWQGDTQQLYKTIDDSQNVFQDVEGHGDVRPSDSGWRKMQIQCREKYKTSGPLHLSIRTKARRVACDGFSIYSNILEINEFIREVVYSHRNQLYMAMLSWMIRMLSEGELFLLIVIDETGTASIRELEPQRIGNKDEDDSFGLITDPDDITHTLYYLYIDSDGKEQIIPDIGFILDAEGMKVKEKYLSDANKELIKRKEDAGGIKKITKGIGSKYTTIGGFRRFVVHLKNLDGDRNTLRDTSSISTSLEFLGYHTDMLKWRMDYIKAITAHTVEIDFGTDPWGITAWHKWEQKTEEEKKATGLLDPYTPGAKILTQPGMSIKTHSAHLSPMVDSDRDIMNEAGVGAGESSDQFSGSIQSASYASIQSTRQPMRAEDKNNQKLFGDFLQYSLFRVLLSAKIKMGGKFTSLGGKEYTIQEFYEKEWVTDMINGEPTAIEKVPCEPCEKVMFTFPVIKSDDTADSVSAELGNNNFGLQAIGVSRKTIAKNHNVQGIEREIKEQALEDKKFGKIKSGFNVTPDIEKKPVKVEQKESEDKEEDGK